MKYLERKKQIQKKFPWFCWNLRKIQLHQRNVLFKIQRKSKKEKILVLAPDFYLFPEISSTFSGCLQFRKHNLEPTPLDNFGTAQLFSTKIFIRKSANLVKPTFFLNPERSSLEMF